MRKAILKSRPFLKWTVIGATLLSGGPLIAGWTGIVDICSLLSPPRLAASLDIQPREVDFNGGEFTCTPWLLNKGTCSVQVIRALDGSAWHARYPHVGVEVQTEDGRVCEWEMWYPGCAMPNLLTENDAITLGPGDRFNPCDFSGLNPGFLEWWPSEPGEYRIRWFYDSTAADPRDWVSGSERTSDIVEDSFHGRVVSDWVTIEFVDE